MNQNPSFPKMAAALAVETVKHIANGCKERPPEEYNRIHRICQSCENVFYTGEIMRCRLCGCNMDIKIKWATSNCPANKW